jgi:hypothetical protein
MSNMHFFQNQNFKTQETQYVGLLTVIRERERERERGEKKQMKEERNREWKMMESYGDMRVTIREKESKDLDIFMGE